MNARMLTTLSFHLGDEPPRAQVLGPRCLWIGPGGSLSQGVQFFGNLDELEAQGEAIIDAVRTFRREQMLVEAADATELVPAPADGTF